MIICEKFCSFEKSPYICSPWCDSQVVRHRSAKPATAVRFRFAPQEPAALRLPIFVYSCKCLFLRN